MGALLEFQVGTTNEFCKIVLGKDKDYTLFTLFARKRGSNTYKKKYTKRRLKGPLDLMTAAKALELSYKMEMGDIA